MHKLIVIVLVAIGAAIPANAAALTRSQATAAARSTIDSEQANGASRSLDGCIFTSPKAVTCSAIFTYSNGVTCYQPVHVHETAKGVIRAKHGKAHCYSTSL